MVDAIKFGEDITVSCEKLGGEIRGVDGKHRRGKYY
jgi:hypothetical protein